MAALFDKDWRKTNRRRGELIDKKIAGTLSKDEQAELECLQAYADYYLDKETPLPTAELERLEALVDHFPVPKSWYEED